jgi:hypothetical protein
MAYSRYEEGVMGKSQGRNLAANLKFKLEGDWVTASKIIDNLPVDIRVALIKGQRVFAKIYLDRLKTNMRNSGRALNWQPLSPKYVKWRASHPAGGFGANNISRLSGDAYRAISIHQKVNSIHVGISAKHDKMKESSGFTISQYMHIFEVGSISRNIKKRPLFKPTFVQCGGQEGLRRTVIKAIGLEYMAKYQISV